MRSRFRGVIRIRILGWRPQRSRPFIAAAERAGKDMRTITLPRYWSYKRGRDEVLASIPTSNIAPAQANEVMKKVNRCSDSVCMRNILVETLRSISTNNATVGADCMSIMLPDPHLLRADIEFIIGSSGDSHGPVYSPWVITPEYVHEPSVLFGGWEIHSGPWTIYLKDVFRGFAAWANQTRPKHPRSKGGRARDSSSKKM
jgi:hypothetical protein